MDIPAILCELILNNGYTKQQLALGLNINLADIDEFLENNVEYDFEDSVFEKIKHVWQRGCVAPY